MDRTYVALIDVEGSGFIEHVVLYQSTDSQLIRICGTFDQGPFGTTLEAVQWLTRTIRLDNPPPID